MHLWGAGNRAMINTILTTAFFALTAILVIKASHFVAQTIWILRYGERYADRVEDALKDNGINYRVLIETIAEMRRHTHVIVFSLFRLLHRMGGVKGRVLNLLIQSVYRMPTLIVAVSVLGYWFGPSWQVIVGGLAVGFGILTQVIYLLATWLKLGRTIIYYYHPVSLKDEQGYKEAVIRRRPSIVLTEFIIVFLIIFIALVIGAGFVHFALEISHLECDYHISDWNPFNPQKSCELSDLSLRTKIGTAITFSYFSLATITTTGFGDIYPVSPWARLVTAIEIMLNLIFITILFFAVGANLTNSGASVSDREPDK
jgi:hypothetical protein